MAAASSPARATGAAGRDRPKPQPGRPLRSSQASLSRGGAGSAAMTDYPPGPGGPDDYDPTGPDHQWVDAPDESQYQELPPLEDEAPAKRKLLTRGRIVAAAAALVLVVGGAGFALSQGGGDDNNNDGIASLDGSGNNSSNGS